MQPILKTGLTLPTAAAVIVLGGAIAATAQVLGPPPSASTPTPTPTTSLPAFNLRATLEALQLRPLGEVIRKKHHLELDAAMADGRRVVVSFDLQGRIWEVEYAEHDKHRFGDGPIDPTAALAAARSAGFGNAMLREVKRHHAVVGAMTRDNEPVELHIDRAGVIYKQVWVRW